MGPLDDEVMCQFAVLINPSMQFLLTALHVLDTVQQPCQPLGSRVKH